MEDYNIGSRINLNGKEFEIIDIWSEQRIFSESEEEQVADVYYVNLKDEHGHILGPVGINTTKKDK